MKREFVHELRIGRTVFANGALAQVPSEVERLGATRALLITTRSAAQAAEGVADALGATIVDRIDEVAQHVPAHLARAAIERTDAADVDLVICLGGGSAVGLAKAIAKERGVAILAVPTTYSGSEMTPIWGITEDGRKLTGRDWNVQPATVIYDPELTVSMPADLTAVSALNAMAHCVEAAYSPGVSPITAALAAEATGTIARGLGPCLADPADLDARSDLLYGAWLAGACLANTSMGIHHKLAHVLGGTFGTPHGETHAALLSHTVAFNEEAAGAAFDGIREALGTDHVAGAIWDLVSSSGAPISIAQVGFPDGSVETVVEAVLASPPANPEPITEAGIRALVQAAMAGRRPTL